MVKDFDQVYFLCVWREGSDADESIILHGLPAVRSWLTKRFWPPGEYPAPVPLWVTAEVDSLVALTMDRSPANCMKSCVDFMYHVYEITDLGALKFIGE